MIAYKQIGPFGRVDKILEDPENSEEVYFVVDIIIQIG
jgi:hypothetical protein